MVAYPEIWVVRVKDIFRREKIRKQKLTARKLVPDNHGVMASQAKNPFNNIKI